MRFCASWLIASLLATIALTTDAGTAAADPLSGLKADRILVKKAERVLYLLREGAVIASYRIALGRNPVGPKVFQGDSRTPEGSYYVASRNAGSRFYRALKVSYPNEEDMARASQYRIAAGGLIMIHGQPNQPRRGHNPDEDWTDGCIAVSNPEMDQIWSAVQVGTPIEIQP